MMLLTVLLKGLERNRARGLRAILEEVMLDVMYDIPSE